MDWQRFLVRIWIDPATAANRGYANYLIHRSGYFVDTPQSLEDQHKTAERSGHKTFSVQLYSAGRHQSFIEVQLRKLMAQLKRKALVSLL